MSAPAGPGVAIVIPSRYASTRLPGKPLAQIDGRPMVWYVWEKAKRSRLASRVVVATDDERIADAVRGFGGEAAMTSPDCASGTDRVAETARGLSEEILVNLQGDEPTMDPSVIDAVIAPLLSDPNVRMTTAALPMADPEEYVRASVVKVAVDDRGDALYFSRSPIPHFREGGTPAFRKHLGIYGYRKDFLFLVAGLAPSTLEEAEKLEQLRVLQNGYRIRVVDVEYDSVGVDTPDDLRSVEEKLCGRNGR